MHILHVCVHYCMMYNVLCTTLCTQYIHTWVVLCRHIRHIHVLYTGMDETTKFILQTCHVMGLDLLLCEKNHILLQCGPSYSAASKLLLRSPAATARSNYKLLYSALLYYCSIYQCAAAAGSSQSDQVHNAWNILSEYWRALINCIIQIIS